MKIRYDCNIENLIITLQNNNELISNIRNNFKPSFKFDDLKININKEKNNDCIYYIFEINSLYI